MERQLRPFLDGDLGAWRGLPQLTATDLVALFGPPSRVEETTLGYYPATRHTFPAPVPSGGLAAYERDGRIVLIESLSAPAPDVLHALPAPTGTLPQEILLHDEYAHEYVYAAQGLVVTVAKASGDATDDRIVRYRGVRRLDRLEDFGPDYYKAFEDQILF